MKAYNLKVNRLSRAIGIDSGTALLSWLVECGVRQSAFRVVLKSGDKLLCDSGKVTSSSTEYNTPIEIPSKTRVEWSVTLWDENEACGESTSAFFETSIDKSEWIAKWIDPEPEHPKFSRRANLGAPLNKASYLKKEFTLDTLGNARLYATAHGVYNVYVNGVAIEEFYMAPGTSNYVDRLQVQTYDVTELLKVGNNELLVTIGEGWYRGSVGWGMARYSFGTQIALLCQLEINGEPVVVTDESWVASQNGPLAENDTMRIERYDARRVIDDWHAVTVEDYGYANLIGTDIPITTHERFSAKLMITPSGQKVLDFGQNFAGYVEFDVMAEGGELIKLTHGEVLSNSGDFQNDNFQNSESPLCRQVIEYTCRKGRNKYHQTKGYYGFRYVLVETDLDITGEEFTGVAVYSDMEQTGFFECGDKRVNRFFNNVIWSMKSNFVDVPTDCPHREKLGFTGDCQVFVPSALYLMDSYPVIRRWLRELVSCQDESGCILYIAPPQEGPQSKPMGMDGSAGWSNAITIVPHRIMRTFGTAEEVREMYPAIKRWIVYNLERSLKSREENESLPEHIRNYILDRANNWGEWCEPGKTSRDYTIERQATGHAEIATAFMALDCLLASDIARGLGENEDAEFFYDAYQKTKAAYRYVYTDNGSINSDRQCHYVRPIVHNLLDGEENDKAAEDLVKLVRENNNHIGTGFLTTCHICDTLSEYGYESVAYDLLLQNEMPSWLYEVEKGATTVWESWFAIREGSEPRGSHNHYSLGAVSKWMMSGVLGIEALDGKITVRPRPDRRLGYAKGSYLSPMGKIASGWRYEGDEIVFDIEIPSNTEADIILPDGSESHVAAGKYCFSIKA